MEFKALGIRHSACNTVRNIEWRDWYANNRDQHRERITANTEANREAARHYVYTYLSNHPCVDCGEIDPMVLTFDHIRGQKRIAISQMVNQGYSLEAIEAELQK